MARRHTAWIFGIICVLRFNLCVRCPVGFVLHVYEKVLVPIWETIVIRFLANVAPQILPFLYERFMKVVDIFVDRTGQGLDAAIDAVVTVVMTIAAVLKGVLWLPMTLCQRLERWAKKPEAK